MKNILITGSGGREHAIGHIIKSQNTGVNLFFYKGNGGTSRIGVNINDVNSIDDLCTFSKKQGIDFVIVGSEDLLVNGIVDRFKEEGINILGPHKKAAMLEGSKVFAKNFMKEYGVKTAEYRSFTSSDSALDFLQQTEKYPLVIKASGLAAGKGVSIVHSLDDATCVIKDFMENKIFGESGNTVVIEEYLEGFEVSILSLYNGSIIYPFISAKDHKQLLDGNYGPNTGGMGVIAPHPMVDDEWWQIFNKDILIPTQEGLKKSNLEFSGVIFFGLMTTASGVYLLEYNVRMGDPETQAVLPLLKSNLLSHFVDAVKGNPIKMEWENKSSCCVVLCADGYPFGYEKNMLISNLENLECSYFIAGANLKNDKLYSSSGRVINVVGKGIDLKEAHREAYRNAEKVTFKNKIFRKDIGIT